MEWTRDDSLRMAYIAAIGQSFRELFNEPEAEPIPDHMRNLLSKLESEVEQERSDGSAG